MNGQRSANLSLDNGSGFFGIGRFEMPAVDGLYYEVSGRPDRPWVVLCHGMALDLENLRPLSARLESDWRIFAWDMPGHGQSLGTTQIDPGIFAGLLEDLLRAHGISEARFIGFSFGGVVAQQLAHRRPDLVSALVAYACLAPYHQNPPVSAALIDAAISSYQGQSWASIQSNFAIACADSQAGRIDAWRASKMTDKATFLRMTRALLTCFEPARDVRFDCPLLIVRGENDSNAALLAEAATGLRTAHPDAVDVIVAAAGHCAHHDAPDALCRSISDFLHKQPS